MYKLQISYANSLSESIASIYHKITIRWIRDCNQIIISNRFGWISIVFCNNQMHTFWYFPSDSFQLLVWCHTRTHNSHKNYDNDDGEQQQ